jgi:SAM-dependent methyltransferase
VTTGFSYSGTELGALAGAHNYYRWILGTFAPHLQGCVVEVGAGVGTFSRLILDEATPSRLVLVEPAANLAPLLRRRFANDDRVDVVHGYLEDVSPATRADAVVLVNVLEHVEHDRSLLDTAARLLVPHGALLVFVPAGPWLLGTLDTEFGHLRRYTRATLRRLLKATGFRVHHLRYFNLPGVVGWLLAGRLLRRRTLDPRDVARYDRWVVPWVARLEAMWRPPFGQSLVAVAARGARQADAVGSWRRA